MRIKELEMDEDILACIIAQKRSFARHPRSTKMANAALERVKALKAAKSGKIETPTSAKKSTPKNGNKAVSTKIRSDVPWQKIADAYNAGLNTKEIAEKFDLVRPKTKQGKENPYPYYLVVGYLTKLSHGVDVDDKHIEITRGSGGTRKAVKK